MSEQTVEIHLGYYKQGDDLGSCLGETKTPQEALKAHAEQMRSVAEHLDKIATIVGNSSIEIQADTHFIALTCEKALAQKLIKAKVANKAVYE